MAQLLRTVRQSFDTAAEAVSRGAEVVSRGVDNISSTIGHVIDSRRSSPLLDQFVSGNVVQLLSRVSGKALQIIKVPVAGHGAKMDVNAAGSDGPDSEWKIINEGSNVIRLYNGNTYLAIANGITCVLSFENHAEMGAETKFRLAQKEEFITLESFLVSGQFVGVVGATGEMKLATEVTAKDIDIMFAVRLIHAAIPLTNDAPKE